MDLTRYLKAGYPAFFIETQETDRVVRSIHAEGFKTNVWDCLRGVLDSQSGRTIDDVIDPLGALNWLTQQEETILIAENFQHFLSSVEVIQAIQNNLHIWKSQGSCLVMAGPMVTLPREIEKYITLLDFPRPTTDELSRLMEELGRSVDVPVNLAAVGSGQGPDRV